MNTFRTTLFSDYFDKAFLLYLHNHSNNLNIIENIENSSSGQMLHPESEAYREIMYKIETIYVTRGPKECIRYIKAIRVSIYQSLSGNRVSIPFTRMRDGLPSYFFKRKVGLLILQKDKRTLQNILTLLQVSYLMKSALKIDSTTITNPSTSNINVEQEFSEWIRIHATGIFKSKEIPYWSQFHKATSAGPNGPATWGMFKDLQLLDQETLSDLIILGGSQLGTNLKNCYNRLEILLELNENLADLRSTPKELTKGPKQVLATHSKRKDTLRRVTGIPAPEGKTRVIAILDYWSQTALKPVHDWAFAQLRELEPDMTFNQAGFVKHMAGRTNYHSFDLSAATDRFPIAVQQTLVEVFSSKERASAWRRILTRLPFTVGSSGEEILYSVGQPMGAYSSWGIFSLCHHLCVRYSASKAGYDPIKFKDYCILGDDLVISNTLVARRYKELITGLGVTISEQKSLVSKDTFEFAKRIVHNDTEMTAFPLAAMIETHKNISALWSVSQVARERGYNFLTPFQTPTFCAYLQARLGRHYVTSLRNCKDLEAFHQYVTPSGGDKTLEWWAVAHLNRSLGLRLSCNHREPFTEFNMKVGGLTIDYFTDMLQAAQSRYATLKLQVSDLLTRKRELDLRAAECRKADKWSIRVGIEVPESPFKHPILQISERESAQIQDNLYTVEVEYGRSDWSSKEIFTLVGREGGGDLTRVISRMANTRASARKGTYITYLRSHIDIDRSDRPEFEDNLFNILFSDDPWDQPEGGDDEL
jgi:hypothetical protein